jgi:hypothetical protein
VHEIVGRLMINFASVARLGVENTGLVTNKIMNVDIDAARITSMSPIGTIEVEMRMSSTASRLMYGKMSENFFGNSIRSEITGDRLQLVVRITPQVQEHDNEAEEEDEREVDHEGAYLRVRDYA